MGLRSRCHTLSRKAWHIPRQPGCPFLEVFRYTFPREMRTFRKKTNSKKSLPLHCSASEAGAGSSAAASGARPPVGSSSLHRGPGLLAPSGGCCRSPGGQAQGMWVASYPASQLPSGCRERQRWRFQSWGRGGQGHGGRPGRLVAPGLCCSAALGTRPGCVHLREHVS